MSSLFKPKPNAGSPAAQAMGNPGGLAVASPMGSDQGPLTASGAKTEPSGLPRPRVRRMPSETDPSVLAAQQRTRRAAMMRKGRQSTILTDNLIGSSGQTLGA